jgi:hypothetical protein
VGMVSWKPVKTVIAVALAVADQTHAVIPPLASLLRTLSVILVMKIAVLPLVNLLRMERSAELALASVILRRYAVGLLLYVQPTLPLLMEHLVVTLPPHSAAPQASAHPGISNAKPSWVHIHRGTILMRAHLRVVKSLAHHPNLDPMSATACNKISSTAPLVEVAANARTANV